MLVLVPTVFELRLLFPEVAAGPWPARLAGRDDDHGRAPSVALCGLGLSEAGARAGVLLARATDEEALLVGLAGTYDAGALPPGRVFAASHVEVTGIGMGGMESGSSRPSDGPLAGHSLGSGPLPLDVALGAFGTAGLLSAATASSTPEEAARRHEAHPRCLAEDMETHAVRVAALAAGKRLYVLRAVSNAAGERGAGGWRIDDAALALREAIESFLESA